MEPPGPDLAAAHAYFPLQTGRFIEYAVDSLLFDFAPGGGTQRDSVRVYLREQVGEPFPDAEGALRFPIERYERSQPTDAWTLKNVWSATRTAAQATRTEDNLRFLRLVFPLDRTTRWDGNRWIDESLELIVAGERIRPFGNWSYQVEALDAPGAVGAFVFDSLLTVTEADYANALERRWSEAQYAKNIGLVRREQWILDSQYCNNNPPPADCATKPWLEKAEKGFVVRQLALHWN
jgi:hypothetical protein